MKIIAIGDIHGRSKEWKHIVGPHRFGISFNVYNYVSVWHTLVKEAYSIEFLFVRIQMMVR